MRGLALLQCKRSFIFDKHFFTYIVEIRCNLKDFQYYKKMLLFAHFDVLDPRMATLPPQSVSELLERAFTFAGMTLGELAQLKGLSVPTNLTYAKGWAGQLIEKCLGANAANLDQPDFINLGIELKTLPVTLDGKISESTYICHASIPNIDVAWESSRVFRKMAKILWFPIESCSTKPLSSLKIGTPLLWSPSLTVAKQLQEDWEELTELISLGDFDNLSAHKGVYLQLRPKAANAKTFIKVVNKDGQTISIVPKGFYLRSKLTEQILKQHYAQSY
jgi:DNA mismatch repair protein MutH